MTESYKKLIVKNRQASFNYFIEKSFEVGIMLNGPELKSLRSNKVNLDDSYADVIANEVFLLNCHIANYDNASKFSVQSSRRNRKLLMHRCEIRKILGLIKQKGYSLVPLSIYFNHKSLVKVEMGLCKGKKLFDKRATIKERDWKKEQGRLMRIK